MMKVNSALANIHRLMLDTAPVIYFIEAHHQYDAIVTEIFRMVEIGAIEAVTSIVTLIETLTKPLRDNNTALAVQYRELLLTSEHFHM